MPVIINGTPVDTNFACKMLWLDVNPQHPGVNPSDHAASGALKQMKNSKIFCPGKVINSKRSGSIQQTSLVTIDQSWLAPKTRMVW